MSDMFNSYRRIIDKLEEDAHWFVVKDFQSSEAYVLSLYRSILDYAKAMDTTCRNKDYIILPVALRAMSEAYAGLDSLARIEGFAASYELSSLDQRRKDINSFISYLDEHPHIKVRLRPMYDAEKEELERIRPFIRRMKADNVKIVKGVNLFSSDETKEVYHTAYRLSNSFLHNDAFAVERRNWKRANGKNAIVSASESRSNIVLSCLFYSIKITSESYRKLKAIFEWPDFSSNLDSRIKSFLVRFDEYANVS